MDRAESFQKVRPTQVSLALTQRLITVGELVKWKDGRVKNGQCTFDENIAEDGVIPSANQTRAKILYQFLLQRMTRWMVTSIKWSWSS